MEAYSVLMSVYHKENPLFFAEAIQSMVDQTVCTDDFVIVCDGPLTAELDAVLEGYRTRYPEIFNIVRLPENVGIGAAANIGLRHCKNALVAKMDSDDISEPFRCERQLEMFEKDPRLSIVGGYIQEFDQNPGNPFDVRQVPLTNEAIRKFARRRQPFNNQTVMYRRDAVMAVGGYRSLRRCEDYDVFLRLLNNDHYAGNLPETLVKVRVNAQAISRRASWSTLRGVVISRGYALKVGYSSLLDFLICVGGELVILICPGCVQRFIYKKYLRQQC